MLPLLLHASRTLMLKGRLLNNTRWLTSQLHLLQIHRHWSLPNSSQTLSFSYLVICESRELSMPCLFFPLWQMPGQVHHTWDNCRRKKKTIFYVFNFAPEFQICGLAISDFRIFQLATCRQGFWEEWAGPYNRQSLEAPPLPPISTSNVLALKDTCVVFMLHQGK